MKLSSIAASALKKLTSPTSTNTFKPTEKSNQDHLRDLQSRLQTVVDRISSYETVEMYGTNPDGFRQPPKEEKLTRAQRRKIQDRQMKAA